MVDQRVVAKQLRQAGFQVAIANHDQEAIAHFHTTHFSKPGGEQLDIVLMDIEMPVMNGLECSRPIREMEANHRLSGKVPMIAVAANTRFEQQDEAMEAGYDAVITKPFEISVLLSGVEEALRGTMRALIQCTPS